MIRDFVAGMLWGGVVAGVGLGAASQMAPMRGASGTPAAEVTAPDKTEVAAEDQAAKAPAPEAAAPEKAPEKADAPAEVAKPAATDGSAAGADALAPKADPAEAKPAATDDKAAEPKPADVATVSPADTAPADTAPDAPTSEAPKPAAPADEPSVVTTPTVEGGAPTLPAASDAPKAAETEIAPLAEPAPPAKVAAAPEPEPEPAPEPAPEPEPESAPLDKAAPELPAAASPAEAPVKEDAADDGAAETLLTPAPEPAKPLPSTIVPDSALPDADGAGQTATLAPDPGLNEPVDGVTTGRLPKIEPAPTERAADAGEAAEGTPRTPMERYAAKFENPAAKPLFAILLIDPGTAELDRAALAKLPFHVTFVIDPLAENAAQSTATYLAGGKEVVMLASALPKGATPGDVEQSFAATAKIMPEAVAVIDMASAGFQDDRQLSASVVPILKAQGRGLITYDRGLNAADQVARREDLAAAVVFRTLDDDGEDTPMIRRYLDRAAFKAAQEGRVVVLGTARPETIAALLEWAVEGRSSSVALAPATAVLSVE